MLNRGLRPSSARESMWRWGWKRRERQQLSRVVSGRIDRTPANAFCDRLSETINQRDRDRRLEHICEGQGGIDGTNSKKGEGCGMLDVGSRRIALLAAGRGALVAQPSRLDYRQITSSLRAQPFWVARCRFRPGETNGVRGAAAVGYNVSGR